MTREIAERNNPLMHPPRVKCPLIVAVGVEEPEGWQQMSKDYFEFCRKSGVPVEYLVEPNANHYTMTEHLLDANRPITQAMIKQLQL